MASLWTCDDSKRWQGTLDRYEEACGAVPKKGDKLLPLDRWHRNELPAAIQGRQPPHITQPELVKLVEWKLTRGKMRPNLLKYSREADPAAVEAASTAAFQHLAEFTGSHTPSPAKSVRAALDELTVIKGVGPATAAGILAAHDESIPIASDEAMVAALGGKDYTAAKVMQLTEALRGKAASLSANSGRQWSVKEVEQCLFAAMVSGSGGGRGLEKVDGSSGKRAAQDDGSEGKGTAAARRKLR